MLKTHKKTLIITSLVTVLPILIGLILWDRLPDQMAIHFGTTNGEADGYAGKAFAVFGLPLILLGVHLLAAAVTGNDPKKRDLSPKVYTLVLWLVPAVSLAVNSVMYLYNMGRTANLLLIAGLILSLLLIVVGNYLPKARQNYTVGIRLPWTLASEENWNRTHRLAGPVWILGGLVMAVLTVCGVLRAGWMIAIFAAVILIPAVYSFCLHLRGVGEE